MWSPGLLNPKRPIAAFDFDSTLVLHRGRGPEAAHTRRFLASISAAFNVVIISNRSSSNAAALAPIKEYVALLDELQEQAAVTVYASTARDRERKPHTGTWEHYTGLLGARPRFAFYCGDAGGRPGDHSATDYMFAKNAGIAFLTPEVLFGNGPKNENSAKLWVEPAVHGCVAEQPHSLHDTAPVSGDWRAAASALTAPCVVVMCGGQASGKTRIALDLAKTLGFTVVSADAQGAKWLHALHAAVAAGERVVVDNTNGSVEARAQCIQSAPPGAALILHVTTSKEICFHLNAARCQLDDTGATREIPPVAIHTFWKRLVEPTDEEAEKMRARLVRIPFSLDASAPAAISVFCYPSR